jgi:hypothetical protein
MNLANTSSEMPVESYPTLNTAIRSPRRPRLAVRLRTRMSAILSESHTHAAGAGASGATAAALGLEEIEIVEMTAAPALDPPVASTLDPPVAPSVPPPASARLPVPASSEPKETAAVAPGAAPLGSLGAEGDSQGHRRPRWVGGNGYILAARAR